MTCERARVQALNDHFRRTRIGGRVLITAGVQALGREVVAQLLREVIAFDRFDADNDPHGEHDFGVVCHAGERVFFKIDYFDRTLTAASPDPADPNLTERVMTIMLSSEY